MASTQEEDNGLQKLIEQAKSLNLWRPAHEQLMNNRALLLQILRPAIELLSEKEGELKTKEGELKTVEGEMKKVEGELKKVEGELIKVTNAVSGLMPSSMKATYSDEEGKVFKAPPITRNTDVTPSIGGNARTITIKDEDGHEKKVKMKIPEADIQKLQTKMWLETHEIIIPIQSKEGKLLPSVLGASYAAQEGHFSYNNEFDVQHLVMEMVKDAINALGLAKFVAAHLEIVLYTLKPDMVVVLRHEGRMFFAIEVKSPGKEDEVFASRNPGGQLWSYLYAMKQLGIERPMGAIMTYDKMVLVTLEDCGEETQHQVVLNSTKKTLNSGVQPTRNAPMKEEDCSTRNFSPFRPQRSVSEAVKTQESVKSHLEEVEMPRRVYYSRIHKGSEVFPGLLQALEVSYLYCKDLSPMRELLVVRDGDSLGRRLFFRVQEDGYNFVLIPSKCKQDGKTVDFRANVGKIPRKNTVYYYMLAKAGEGHEGTVYIACNNSGRLCAIKVYHIKKSSASTDPERRKDEEQEKNERYEVAKMEAERWMKIYGTRFGAVRPKYLGGTPCLLMPYGVEVENEATRRLLMPGIEKELKRIAKKHKLRYKKSDLRWRHVLLQPKKDSEEDSELDYFFLSDFSSLETFDEKDDIEEVVKSQMDALKRAREEKTDALSTPGMGRKRKYASSS